MPNTAKISRYEQQFCIVKFGVKDFSKLERLDRGATEAPAQTKATQEEDVEATRKRDREPATAADKRYKPDTAAAAATTAPQQSTCEKHTQATGRPYNCKQEVQETGTRRLRHSWFHFLRGFAQLHRSGHRQI